MGTGKLPYGQRLRQRAWREFTGFWSAYRYWASIAPVAVAVLSLAAREGWSSLMSAADVIVNAGAGLLVTLVGTYIISVVRSIKMLDNEWRFELGETDLEISSLSSELEAFNSDPIRMARSETVAASLASLEEDTKRILKFILIRGRVRRSELPDSGLSLEAATRALAPAIYEHLIETWHDASRFVVYSIRPEFRDAIARAMLGKEDPPAPIRDS